MNIPEEANVVIIGGGVIGCSIAYHLGKLGWKDILLLERKKLTCGTTWHAAGLIAQLRATQNMTRLAKYSQELYWDLEKETGVVTGFKRNGSMTVALTEERLEELNRQADMARAYDVEIENIDKAEIKSRYPHLNTEDVLGGLWLPKDGQADPVNITQALAKGARNFGVKILEDVKVLDIETKDNKISGVKTEKGYIKSKFVVNAGGMWGQEIGKMAGASVPLHACEHFYIVTEPIEGLKEELPVLRVPDECAYYKEDAGKILLGAFEPNSKPWGGDGIPEDFEFDSLPEDFDHFEPILERAINRFPHLGSAGIKTFFNGPESFTVDNRYLLGETPEIKNFFVAAGFNSVGIQSAGGAGKVLADWIKNGRPNIDLWEVDIRRMMPFQRNKQYLKKRVSETLGLLYADHFPYRQFETGRDIKRSPIHSYLKKYGACFGETSGWERPNWFLNKQQLEQKITPEYKYSWKRQNWFENSADEHNAVRKSVGLYDLSSFGKIRIVGRDAEDFLQKICGNNIAVSPGKIVYTQFLNDDGGIESDITITRLSSDEFLVVTPAATIQKDINWIKGHIPDNAHCYAYDATCSEAVISIMGPDARKFLQPLILESLDNEKFPFGTAKEIEIGMGIARAHRISYVGELGWEIYISSDMSSYVFEEIMKRNSEMPIKLCGLHSLDSCRIEKAYRHYGHDISSEDNIIEAGLGFAVKTHKPKSKFGDFIGKNAVEIKKQEGVQKRMMQFVLENPEPLLFHNEPIIKNDKIVGYLTSGNYGHHLGSAVGMGYVECDKKGESPEEQLKGEYMIDVAGKRYTATPYLKPAYDPSNVNIKI